MADQRPSPVKILALTRKDNCGDCGVPTCMAFAAQVSLGTMALTDCPHIPEIDSLPADLAGLAAPAASAPPGGVSPDPQDLLRQAKPEFDRQRLEEASRRLGIPIRNGRIVVRCFGKPFEVDEHGDLHTLCHVNPWVHLPILNYLTHGTGRPLSGNWVPFAKLSGGIDWSRFFEYRCERELTLLAEKDPELLCDVLDLFGGAPPPDLADENMLNADRVNCLEPLPGVGILFRCWLPDGDFETKLSLLYDRASTHNLDAGAIFYLTRGLTQMFTRVTSRHGSAGA